MKKLIVALVAAASVANIAHADSSTPAKPEFVEIDVTVTKDLGESVELFSKVSMRTDKTKPVITSDRRTITYRKAIARSNNEKFNYDNPSEISVGVDAVFFPASDSHSDMPPYLDSDQVVVTIDDVSNWTKFHMPETQESIELPSSKREYINVTVQSGRPNVVKQDGYTVTVTEHAVNN